MEWILALLKAVCPFPRLQLCNCEACWGAACFSSLGGGFLFPAIPPVVCFAPGLSLPICTAGSCLTLLMETVPCRCLKILPLTLPACSLTHVINALCQLQLPLWSRSSTLSPGSNLWEVSGDSAHCSSWLRLYLKESKKLCSSDFCSFWSFLSGMGLRGTCSAHLVPSSQGRLSSI